MVLGFTLNWHWDRGVWPDTLAVCWLHGSTRVGVLGRILHGELSVQTPRFLVLPGAES